MRVSSADRFSAFLDGVPFYIALERPCAKCGSFKKRTRDRSCYGCHLRRGGENFERVKAGVSPIVSRSKDGHLDLLARKKAEREGKFIAAEFGQLSVRRYPTGRLEVTFPDGYPYAPPSVDRQWRHRRGASPLWNRAPFFPTLPCAVGGLPAAPFAPLAPE
ncbi:hypothetical protein [Sphingomonas cavernae]|uniref:hypothetical protein n=1 Tax=Sphingomonas cavernae TaxID=2320861 RepID=UPI0011C359EE|nr:hypothetical protein [Sphingomonas cavernae]